jgi:hypothetical protein
MSYCTNLLHQWRMLQLAVLLTHLVLDTLDPVLSSSTPAPMTTSSNTLLQSDDAAALYDWTIKLDGELMWLIVASCAVAVAGERRHYC